VYEDDDCKLLPPDMVGRIREILTALGGYECPLIMLLLYVHVSNSCSPTRGPSSGAGPPKATSCVFPQRLELTHPPSLELASERLFEKAAFAAF
jgi:hypothetical protein